jgi:hypothetical protein
MRTTYCDGWFRARHRPGKIWDEARARKAHDRRKLYTVLVGDPARPDCFLELNKGWVGVTFLDSRLREIVDQSFHAVDDSGRLFLGMVTFRRFEGEADLVAAGVSYTFEPDGAVLRSYQEFPTTQHARTEPRGFADVSGFWEPYPEFGHYEAFVKRDRVKPSVLGEDADWILRTWR